MRITNLEFHDFRNYESLSLSNLGDLVIFCGPNAVGKTNILEGICLLTAASTFRHAQIGQLIRQGSDGARIQIQMSDGNRQLQNVLLLEPGKRKYLINGKSKSATDVRGILPAVSFIPDDLNIAKRSSSVKRDALDSLGVQVSKNYSVVHKDYEKALRYKNRLLKDESPQAMVDAINETLTTVASQLYCYRRSLYERMVPLVCENYRGLSQSGEEFQARYVPSWLRMQQRMPSVSSFSQESAEVLPKEDVSAFVYEALQLYSTEERRARRALIGPHNDEVTFMLSGKDSSQFASQGQQRSIVLAWKLAEVKLVQQTIGVSPVLLLDDVMSELDESRRAQLVQTVTADIQTFITTTDLSPFKPDLLARAQVIHLPK